jgi:hypothetical protein
MLLKGRMQFFRGCKSESLPVIRQAAKLLSEACRSAQQFQHWHSPEMSDAFGLLPFLNQRI